MDYGLCSSDFTELQSPVMLVIPPPCSLAQFLYAEIEVGTSLFYSTEDFIFHKLLK